MELTRTSTTAAVLDIGDLRDHLSLDDSSLDTVVNACQRAAVDLVERETNTQIGPGAYTLVTDFPPGRGDIVLPKPPLVAVQSVTYLDPAGNSMTLDPSVYRVSHSRPGRLVLRAHHSWPATAGDGSVTITFTAGYALTQVPEALLHAVRLLTGSYLENREATSPLTIKEVPYAVDLLLNQFRFLEAV